MPDDFINFLPVVQEDIDSVRARFDGDATASLDPSDPRYPDLTPGGFYWDTTQPCVIECVRLWDALTEAVAAQFPGTAWGEYLDLHGETINVPRKDEVAASGEVLFAGPVGTLIPAGTVVSTEVADPSSLEDPIEFETQVSVTLAPTPGPTGLAAVAVGAASAILAAGTYYYRVTAISGSGETIASNEAYATAVATGRIDLTWVAVGGATSYNVYRGNVAGVESLLGSVSAGGKAAPTGVVATPSAAGGTLAAGTRYYKVTALDAVGETLASAEVSAVVPGGGTGSVTVTWNPVFGVRQYRVYYGTAAGVEGNYLVAAGAPTTLTDTGTAGTAGTPPVGNTTSAVGASDTGRFVPTATAPPTNRALAVATEAGSRGNVSAGSVVLVQSPINGGPSVTNDSPMTGGADVESDAPYRRRILLAFGSAQGAGTQADYEQWALAFPAVGYATVQPLWNGAGTVRVIVTDRSNRPESALVIAALQTDLDPIPGMGAGRAPIGAIVTVATPTLLNIDVAGSPTFQTGYSLDGAGGTVPLRDAITDSIKQYVNGLKPGDDVILANVIARFFLVPGVLDVTGVTLNGTTANVVVGALQVAYSDSSDVTLT